MHHVLTDPASGAVLHLSAGTRLELRFRRPRLGESRWRIAHLPAHLVLLPAPRGATSRGREEPGRCAFHFLVFGAPLSGSRVPLRLERVRPGRDEPCDVRELSVVTASASLV